MSFSIKLPEKYYGGFKSQGSDDLPLGYIVPHGTDFAFDKRKASVDNWIQVYNSTALDTITFDNTPVTGFKLGRSIKRTGWNGGNVVVRIEDPRGFEVEITVANLLKIMENNTIENTEILAECIWGRDGGKNILLAVNSEPYLEAVENTNRATRKVSLKDIKPGMTVRLKNGHEGTYLGLHYATKWTTQYKNNSNANIYCGIHALDEDTVCSFEKVCKKNHFILYNKPYSMIDSHSSLSVADIIDTTTISMVEAEKILNENINENNVKNIDFVTMNDYTMTMSLEPLSKNIPDKKYYNSLALTKVGDSWYATRYDIKHYPHIEVSEFNYDEFISENKIHYIREKRNESYRPQLITKTTKIKDCHTRDWFVLKLNIASDSGNNYEYEWW